MDNVVKRHCTLWVEGASLLGFAVLGGGLLWWIGGNGVPGF